MQNEMMNFDDRGTTSPDKMRLQLMQAWCQHVDAEVRSHQPPTVAMVCGKTRADRDAAVELLALKAHAKERLESSKVLARIMQKHNARCERWGDNYAKINPAMLPRFADGKSL